MSEQKPNKLLQVTYGGTTFHWHYTKKTYELVDEGFLRKQIPGFYKLNESYRQKAFKRFLQRCKIIDDVYAPRFLPNTRKKLHPEDSRAREPTPEDRTAGARVFLCTAEVFKDQSAGYRLTADILCGPHCSALHNLEAGFRPALAIDSKAPALTELLTGIVRAAVPRRSWKRGKCHITRDAVLDFRTPSPLNSLPHHIQDFSQLKVKVKGKKPLKIPAYYADSIALIIGATAAQIREAAPYIENAAVILLNSSPGDFAPTRLPPSSVAAYDPKIAARIKQETPRTAALLRWWWERFEDEDSWARQIVQKARASLGKPDDRYIRVEFEPKRLRDAIRYQVFLSFLDELERDQLMTAEELTPYRQGAKEVFDPDPPEAVPVRRAEDPEVFLEIMRKLSLEKTTSIVSEGERFVKAGKPFAAWRTISGERHLVIQEDTWAQEYKKAVRAEKNIDTSIFQQTNWKQEVQKLLCGHGLIKAPSAGYRYRHDLFGNGTRDTTYVVAIPAKLLEK